MSTLAIFLNFILGEKKSVVRVKRVHSPEDDLADHSPKKITKRMKPESVKVSKESLREGTQTFLHTQSVNMILLHFMPYSQLSNNTTCIS